MKTVSIIGLYILACQLIGCAGQNYQAMYRGNPNVPHHRIVPLGVNPNAIYAMNDIQYNQYMTRLERYQPYTGRAIELDMRSANAAKQWVNDSNQTNQYAGAVNDIASNATRTFSNEVNRSIRDAIHSMFNN